MTSKTSKLGSFLRRLFTFSLPGVTLRCRDVTRLYSRSLDVPLPWYTRFRIRLHVTTCVWCRRYGDQLRFLRAFSRAFPEHDCEPGDEALPQESRDRLKVTLREHLESENKDGV